MIWGYLQGEWNLNEQTILDTVNKQLKLKWHFEDYLEHKKIGYRVGEVKVIPGENLKKKKRVAHRGLFMSPISHSVLQGVCFLTRIAPSFNGSPHSLEV